MIMTFIARLINILLKTFGFKVKIKAKTHENVKINIFKKVLNNLITCFIIKICLGLPHNIL